jgi:hypothetical protein
MACASSLLYKLGTVLRCSLDVGLSQWTKIVCIRSLVEEIHTALQDDYHGGGCIERRSEADHATLWDHPRSWALLAARNGKSSTTLSFTHPRLDIQPSINYV